MTADDEKLDALVAELELVGTEYRAAREGVAAINALRARVAELDLELSPHREEAERRKRESGDYWLTVEGRAQVKELWPNREDGNACRPLLDALESAESQLRQVKADAAVAQVDPANEQMPYPHIVRLRELTEADVGSKLYAAAPKRQPFKCSMAGCDEPAIYQRPQDQPCVCKQHDPGR